MPVSIPPAIALREFLGATTRHIRRVEIYEQDGITRWEKDTEPRLKEGSVSVDYTRDERRSIDLTLSNDDGVLINAPGEFWYDKVIKVFRGVRVDEPIRAPRVLVVSDSTVAVEERAPSFRAALLRFAADYGDIQVNTLADSLTVSQYDIVVSLSDQDNGQLLTDAYNAGKSVLAFRKSAEYMLNKVLGSTSWAGATLTGNSSPITPRVIDDPRTVGWPDGFVPVVDAITYKAPATSISSLFGVAFASGSTTNYVITSQENAVGGKFVAVHLPITAYQFSDDGFEAFLFAAMNWLNPVVPLAQWEVQIGEFMIDRISEPHFPYEIKITGRDYTKKCMLSKFTEATQFAEGSSLESVIGALAINAGITKRLLPPTGIVIGRAFFFERGTSRWDAMKEIATAYNYEIFFDASGYLVIRPFRDPSATAPVVYIETGKDGQVASYEKSTSDASLFNHTLVTGESSDTAVIPVWAEAKNTDPNSPTSIDEIGDRYWEYSSAFITTKAQAQELADSYLAIHQLEEFELSFESLMLPWLEVGDILGWIDPRPAPGDPTTFLLTSLSLPLGLSPMSGVGRRVLIVS